MNKLKVVGAYLIACAGWFVGVAIGVIWATLENGGEEAIEGNNIDLEMLLIDNLLPAIISMLLSNWLLKKVLSNSENKEKHIIIFNVFAIFIYGGIFFSDLAIANYGNILYSIIGVGIAAYYIKNSIDVLKDNKE